MVVREKKRPGRKTPAPWARHTLSQWSLPVWLQEVIREQATLHSLPYSAFVTGILTAWVRKHLPDKIPVELREE